MWKSAYVGVYQLVIQILFISNKKKLDNGKRNATLLIYEYLYVTEISSTTVPIILPWYIVSAIFQFFLVLPLHRSIFRMYTHQSTVRERQKCES